MREFSPKLNHQYVIDTEREAKRRERLRIIPGSIAIVASLFYWGDVADNYQEAQSSVPKIEIVHEPEGGQATSAIIFFPGLGDNEAERLASTQGPVTDHVLDGEWWSMDYNNAFLNEGVMANYAEDFAEERGIKEFSVYGYSAGGPISLKTAVKILDSKDNDLLFKSAWLDSAPAGDEGIQPEQKQIRDVALSITDLAPSARYSSFVRYFGEMAFRADQFLVPQPNWFLPNVDYPKLEKVSNFVAKGLEDGRIPGTWLLIDQVLAASNDDTEDSLHKIAELTQDSLEPVTISMRTAQPDRDPLVNSVSAENTCSYAAEVDLPCYIYDIRGAVHNLPEAASEEYNATIFEASPELKATLAKNLLKYYQGFYDPVEITYSTEPLHNAHID